MSQKHERRWTDGDIPVVYRAYDEAITTVLRMLSVILGVIHYDDPVEGLQGGPRIDRTIRSEVVPQRVENHSLEERLR